MDEGTIRSILRLIAVVTILVGTVQLTTTLVSLGGVTPSSPDELAVLQNRVNAQVYRMGLYMAAANALTVAWGALFYFWSASLARRIVR